MVAGADAPGAQRPGEAAGAVVELGVGDRLARSRHDERRARRACARRASSASARPCVPLGACAAPAARREHRFSAMVDDSSLRRVAASAGDVLRRAPRPDRQGRGGHGRVARASAAPSCRPSPRPAPTSSIASRKLDACEAAAAEVRAVDRAAGRGRSPATSAAGTTATHLVADDARPARPARRAREQRRHVAAVREPRRRHRGALRQDAGREPEGPVPARRAGGHAHGRPRRRLDHQHRHRRLARRQHQRAALRLRQGRPQRPHRRAWPRPSPRRCGSTPSCPGPFRTDVTKAWAARGARGRRSCRSAAWASPTEVAPLALHLASAASSYTTGAIIRVDGGITRKV